MCRLACLLALLPAACAVHAPDDGAFAAEAVAMMIDADIAAARRQQAGLFPSNARFLTYPSYFLTRYRLMRFRCALGAGLGILEDAALVGEDIPPGAILLVRTQKLSGGWPAGSLFWAWPVRGAGLPRDAGNFDPQDETMLVRCHPADMQRIIPPLRVEAGLRLEQGRRQDPLAFAQHP